MTTATLPKPKTKLTPATALAEHRGREERWGAAERQASELARELANKIQGSRALHDQRRRLIHQDPSLVDHLDQPTGGTDSPIAAIDRELAAIGELGELNAKVEHSRRISELEKQKCADYAKAHYPLIVKGLRAEKGASAAAFNEQLVATHRLAVAYLDDVHAAMGLAALAGRDPRSVPGLDSISELVRILDGWQFPVPLPENPE